MPVYVSNTEVTNSFDYWRNRTNELAQAMRVNAVTVESNAAIGNSMVIGSFSANNLYTLGISGGMATNGSSVGFTSNLVITSNTVAQANVWLNDRLVVNNAVSVGNTLTVNSSVVRISTPANMAVSLTIGNTVVNTTSLTTNNYFGTWSGSNVAPTVGGTGTNTAPTAGQVLIGTNTGVYTPAALTPGTGISINSVSGQVTFNNSGVVSFRANTTNTPRTGAITLTNQDVIDALSYVPGAANASVFLPVGSDTYFPGNAAIGFGATAVANASLEIRSANNTGSKPIARFDVANATATATWVDIGTANNSAQVGVRFANGVPGSTMSPRGSVRYNMSNDSFTFNMNTTDRVTLDSSGNIGINTPSPQPNETGQGLHVSGTLPGITLSYNGTGAFDWVMGVNPAFNYLNAGARTFDSFGVYSDAGGSGLIFQGKTTATSNAAIFTGGSQRMVIDQNGVGYFGTTTQYGGAIFNAGGDVSSTGFVTTSDYRLKENIVPLTGALDRVKLLNPVQFDYVDGAKRKEGFIAHELQQVVPTAVRGVKDGFMMQEIDKTDVIALLTKAVQELLNKVEELEAKLGSAE